MVYGEGPTLEGVVAKDAMFDPRDARLHAALPAWLGHAQRTLDEAVAEAYGWGEDWRLGTLSDDGILARLFHLNQQRAEGTEHNRKRNA